jgi:hypothetical protein
MTEVITFPDLEAAAKSYLTAQLSAAGDTATVVVRIPPTRPNRMVKVNRTGGSRVGLVLEDAQITVECWDTRADRAHDLAQLVRGLLWVMPDRYPAITTYRVQELGGLVNLPDPDTANPRYTFTVLITTRGTALP